MSIITASIYWVIVSIWLVVLGTVLILYLRNRRSFGTTRLLLLVVGIDTLRNIIENVYFGLFFGGQYGLFPKAVATTLGNPFLLIVPKVVNVGAGCIVLGVLLLRWLPEAVNEHKAADRRARHLQELAATDGMTGLWNRQEFMALAGAEWHRSRRYKRPLSLLLLDIDQFKSINDRYGHDAGDEVIIRIAKLCAAQKRSTDIAGRLGGEEFVVLLPETTALDAYVFAERLRNVIAAEIIIVGVAEIKTTVSIGISDSACGDSIPEFLKQSDVAMYSAKTSGRNRVCNFALA